MEISPLTLLLVGIICAVLGFLASNLLGTLQDEGGGAVLDEDATPPGGKKGLYTPVVKLWRQKQKGNLLVEIDGKTLVDRSPLSDTQRVQLEEAARDLRAWLGMGLVQSSPLTSDMTPAELPVDEALLLGIAGGTVQTTGSPDNPVAATMTVSATSTGMTGAGAARADVNQTPRQSPTAGATTYAPVHHKAAVKSSPPKPPVSGKAGDDAKELPAGSKSIVMQIEDILQDMLAGTPLEQRGIHLSEDPVRGVIVTVGIDHYEGIEAVPDPEVKTAVRRAVQEWEQNR